jgi:TonB family protein
MIPRTLVPRDVRPATTPETAPRRLTTLLDGRMVVAANLPRITIDTHSNIPSHLPLDVLASRVVVPRDMPTTPLDPASVNPDYAPVTVLDHRMAVPMALPVVELASKPLVSSYNLPDVLDPDVLTTGEVNLMVAPVEQPDFDWHLVSRIGSVAAHVAFLVLILLLPRLFPYRPPTQAEVDMARQQLNFIYMPPDVRGTPRAPAAPTSPQMRIDPRVLREITPNSPELQPIPKPRVPEQVVREAPTEAPPDLPAAPKPQTAERPLDTVRPTPQTQPDTPSAGLILPRLNRSLEESAQEAIRSSGSPVQSSEGQIPGVGRGGGGGGQNGGGGAQGTAGAGIEMLTPTEGVDFTSYLARVLASVKRNWYAVMPESARLGDQGRVVLQFRILRDGEVPGEEPQLMNGSGKEPLDRAAMSSIRSSSPFEPLPSAFSSPYIELRFIFLYNLPMNYQ